MTAFIIGDLVTNRHWIGKVIGVCEGWVWVLPIAPYGNATCSLFDGPLTLRQDGLEPAQ